MVVMCRVTRVLSNKVSYITNTSSHYVWILQLHSLPFLARCTLGNMHNYTCNFNLSPQHHGPQHHCPQHHAGKLNTLWQDRVLSSVGEDFATQDGYDRLKCGSSDNVGWSGNYLPGKLFILFFTSKNFLFQDEVVHLAPGRSFRLISLDWKTTGQFSGIMQYIILPVIHHPLYTSQPCTLCATGWS